MDFEKPNNIESDIESIKTSTEAPVELGVNSQELENMQEQSILNDKIKLDQVRNEIAQIKFTADDIKEVPREEIAPQFGNDSGVVREDLPEPIKKFVKEHEAYHMNDKKGGPWWMEEIRANLHAGKKHPWGLLRTITASLFSKERLKLYADRIKKRY